MTFVQAIQSGFKNYVKFTGRASRSEYWWFVLFEIICIAIPYSLMLGETMRGQPGLGTGLYWIVALAFFLPGLGLSFRRLHDTERTAWWLLLCLVPIAGLVVLVFCCLPGTKGPNKFGDDPLASPSSVAKTFE